VGLLLAGCGRETAVGRRDYAVLSLLARLGLRRAEAVGVRLDDICWRAGEVVICRKGRIERLPLAVSCGRGGACEDAGLFVLLQSRYRRI
jgi:site-specific recombinase XerD